MAYSSFEERDYLFFDRKHAFTGSTSVSFGAERRHAVSHGVRLRSRRCGAPTSSRRTAMSPAHDPALRSKLWSIRSGLARSVNQCVVESQRKVEFVQGIFRNSTSSVCSCILISEFRPLNVFIQENS